MHRLLLAATVAVTACTGTPAPTDSGTSPSDACALAADSAVCPDCTDGPLTCGFAGVEVTVGSCGECQSRAALYQALCDAGETADRATIESGTVCHEPTCVVWADTCVDPCAQQCVRADEVPTDTTCDLGCPDTALPDPGICAWNGTACAFE
ncbi:MAG: hypothetical protein ABMB14_05510 [Myxococcota bacterium]